MIFEAIVMVWVLNILDAPGWVYFLWWFGFTVRFIRIRKCEDED